MLSGEMLKTKGDTVAATFTGNGTYNYTSAYDKEYYSGTDTAITSNAATTPTTTFEVKGLKETSDKAELAKAFNESSKTLTLTSDYLNESEVTISDG